MNLASDPIDGDRIRRALIDATIGREVIVLAETTSTNDEILCHMDTGSEGLVIIAETQTAGRGQRGNSWESKAGKGLWFSTLLRPDISLADSGALTTWAANAMVTALHESYAIDSTVKPPNDIYIGARKLAGLLVEMRARPASTHSAVLGIGINVNHTRLDFSTTLRACATSLALELHHPVERNELAITLLRALDNTYPFRKAPIR